MFLGKKGAFEPNENVATFFIVSLLTTFFCRENDFEDGNHLYRFVEHEPFIHKCFNFRGAVNDNEPKTAALICDRLTKIMSAILESYASDDRKHVDYAAISRSEEFRRYDKAQFVLTFNSFYCGII